MSEPRPLGSTGVMVSPIGLGLAALGRPGYLNLGHGDDLAGRSDPEALGQHTQTVLDTAYAAGITYYDAARSYGRAEEFLSNWISDRGIQPGDVTVGSKWGYEYVADWRTDADVHETKTHDVAMLNRQHGESTVLLGSHLTLYQIHSATRASNVLNDVSIRARLAELRDGGTLVGLSTSGPDQAETIREAVAIEFDGAPLFSTVQSTWNLFEPSAREALREAAEAGLGVIIKEAVANGRLTARNPELAARLEAVLPGHRADAIAIAAAVRRPWVSVVLSGASTSDQLASNMRALEITAEEVDRIPDLAEPPVEYWRRRGALGWT